MRYSRRKWKIMEYGKPPLFKACVQLPILAIGNMDIAMVGPKKAYFTS